MHVIDAVFSQLLRGVAALLCAFAVGAHASAAGAPASAAGAPALEPAVGGHGMVLFGGQDGLYAAHLPMFHPPHDYQVLLRLRFDPGLDAELRRTLAAAPALWTLDPERFDLTRLHPRSADPLHGFTATLYAGHFERGGEVRHRDVRVHVDAVVLFRRLDPQRATSAQIQYHVVGEGRERFLVKLVDGRPDFDHIVAVDAGTAAAAASGTLPRPQGLGPAAAELDAFVHRLFGDRARVRGTVYLDAQDLQ